ncbi:TIGR02466 family protein [Pseudooceanicola algae]|uniref:JmjC domain-containing protein n=1 Tax=Pseudooceanicola algae TaxID=1537215 RepID=A0A418SD29_9RHOB|nr:TIGR02466 family protein [Pseudooceanicola algae]QPM92334.1 hypothetical protein PSAL_035980 [Pseudooceanicola algae]
MTDKELPQVNAPLGPIKRESHFPTGIYFRDFNDAAEVNSHLLEAVLAERAADETGISRSNVSKLGGWHSQTDLHRKPAFADFSARLLATVTDIGTSLRYDPAYEIAIDNMWAIMNPPGSYNRAHIHPNTLWSGVYYIQVPQESGRIVFTDPRSQALTAPAMFDPSQPRTPESWSEVFFDPRPGRMILFPNWLYHEVAANMSELIGLAGERVILSFNLFQRRRK